jgi:hypothetical protein
MNFGNFFPQSNDAQNSGAIMGGTGNLTQTVNANNNNNVSNNTMNPTNAGSISFGAFTFSI